MSWIFLHTLTLCNCNELWKYKWNIWIANTEHAFGVIFLNQTASSSNTVDKVQQFEYTLIDLEWQ